MTNTSSAFIIILVSGGMIPEEAFSMVDGYIMKIEDMNNAVKIDSMMRQAEYEFAECVAGRSVVPVSWTMGCKRL